MSASKPQNPPNPNPEAPRVVWDDSSMDSMYANVCNVSSTREEFVLLFGVNKSWTGTEQEVTVELRERVIMSPFAAKRLHRLLGGVLDQYEERFGALEAGSPPIAGGQN